MVRHWPFGKQTDERQDRKCELLMSKKKRGGAPVTPQQAQAGVGVSCEVAAATVQGVPAPQPTSDSRRMLRFSLLPVLGPFPLVGFCSGMVTSGAGRGSERTVKTCYHPDSPGRRAGPGRRLLKLGLGATETARGDPSWRGPIFRARPPGPAQGNVQPPRYGTREGFADHLLGGNGLERDVPRRAAHPFCIPPSSFLQTAGAAEGHPHLLPLLVFAASSFFRFPCMGDCPDPDFSSFFTTSCEGCKKTKSSLPRGWRAGWEEAFFPPAPLVTVMFPRCSSPDCPRPLQPTAHLPLPSPFSSSGPSGSLLPAPCRPCLSSRHWWLPSPDSSRVLFWSLRVEKRKAVLTNGREQRQKPVRLPQQGEKEALCLGSGPTGSTSTPPACLNAKIVHLGLLGMVVLLGRNGRGPWGGGGSSGSDSHIVPCVLHAFNPLNNPVTGQGHMGFQFLAV